MCIIECILCARSPLCVHGPVTVNPHQVLTCLSPLSLSLLSNTAWLFSITSPCSSSVRSIYAPVTTSAGLFVVGRVSLITLTHTRTAFTRVMWRPLLVQISSTLLLSGTNSGGEREEEREEEERGGLLLLCFSWK